MRQKTFEEKENPRLPQKEIRNGDKSKKFTI
jgi:hypothetical protein